VECYWLFAYVCLSGRIVRDGQIVFDSRVLGPLLRTCHLQTLDRRSVSDRCQLLHGPRQSGVLMD
jgi:hypothetical protein